MPWTGQAIISLKEAGIMPTAYGSRFASQRAELLRCVAHIGFFEKLTDAERHDLLAKGSMRNFNDGDVIFE